MFKKLAVITAAIILTTAGVVGASTATQAVPTEGPCIIAVLKDDPTIKAKRGNCQKAATYSVDLTIGAMGVNFAERGLHVTVFNQTSGDVLVDADSMGVERLQDHVTKAPTYLVTFVIDNKGFSRYLRAEDFTKSFEDEDTVSWTLNGNIVFDSVAYKYLDDFSADPAMQYGEPQ